MEVEGGGAGATAETAVRKGPWTMEEDLVRDNYVAANGEGSWNSLARTAGLNRTCGAATSRRRSTCSSWSSRGGGATGGPRSPGTSPAGPTTRSRTSGAWRTKIQKKRGEGASESAVYQPGTAAAVPFAVTESQSSSSNSVGRATDYDVGGQPRGWDDHRHQLGYVGHAGGGGACAGGVPPEFLQAAVAAAGDSFWGFEEFWPTVPSLHGDC